MRTTAKVWLVCVLTIPTAIAASMAWAPSAWQYPLEWGLNTLYWLLPIAFSSPRDPHVVWNPWIPIAGLIGASCGGCLYYLGQQRAGFSILMTVLWFLMSLLPLLLQWLRRRAQASTSASGSTGAAGDDRGA